MKNLKIQVPEGYEIDKENSTFENIILKKIEKKLPLSVREIEGREWFITGGGSIDKADYRFEDLNNLSSEERAEAFLALMQLVELRDAWIEGCNTPFDPNTKHTIIYRNGEIVPRATGTTNRVLSFQTRELRDRFLAQFKDLIETAKELI